MGGWVGDTGTQRGDTHHALLYLLLTAHLDLLFEAEAHLLLLQSPFPLFPRRQQQQQQQQEL